MRDDVKKEASHACRLTYRGARVNTNAHVAVQN